MKQLSRFLPATLVGATMLGLSREVGVMQHLLQQAGVGVAVATASGEPRVAVQTSLVPDLKCSDIKVTDWAALVLPSLAAGHAGIRSVGPDRRYLTDSEYESDVWVVRLHW